MNNLSAIAIIAALVCLTGARAAEEPLSSNGLWAMQCTEEGTAQGFKGKALEDFVGKCMQAKTSSGGRDSSTPPPETPNC